MPRHGRIPAAAHIDEGKYLAIVGIDGDFTEFPQILTLGVLGGFSDELARFQKLLTGLLRGSGTTGRVWICGGASLSDRRAARPAQRKPRCRIQLISLELS